MPTIDYESVGFPAGLGFTDGLGQLTASWDELLWSTLTVGRPSIHYVFKNGQSSYYEALFRLSLIRMALEQAGPLGGRFVRTSAYESLDPSEKGAVSYFLGLNLAKLFAYKLLEVPWLLHLDVFWQTLKPLLTGRSRPDLVGQTTSSDWLALESKGRIGMPDNSTKAQAKAQAQRVVSIDGVVPAYAIGAITHFSGDELRFYWEDPPASEGGGIEVQIPPAAWRHHYLPALGLVRAEPDGVARLLDGVPLIEVKHANMQVGIHPAVLKTLLGERWDEARTVARERGPDLKPPYQSDGIAVVAGPSWSERYADLDYPRRALG